jgi:hypothetical protein
VHLRHELGTERFEAFRAELVAEMHRELRAQTWRLLTALIALMTMLIALFGVVLAVGTGS